MPVMINGSRGGRRYRYSYNALPVDGWFGFRGVVKYDVETGTEETVELADGVFASETVMAPRDGSTAEDDGYLLTFTSDVNADRSECLILDASRPTAGPVARGEPAAGDATGACGWLAAGVGGRRTGVGGGTVRAQARSSAIGIHSRVWRAFFTRPPLQQPAAGR